MSQIREYFNAEQTLENLPDKNACMKHVLLTDISSRGSKIAAKIA